MERECCEVICEAPTIVQGYGVEQSRVEIKYVCRLIFYQHRKNKATPNLKAFYSTAKALKVGSCPNDENSVQISFYAFMCSIRIFMRSESVAVEKTARFCLEFCVLSFVYFLCHGIPILKVVLLHAQKWVISDVIL